MDLLGKSAAFEIAATGIAGFVLAWFIVLDDDLRSKALGLVSKASSSVFSTSKA